MKNIIGKFAIILMVSALFLMLLASCQPDQTVTTTTTTTIIKTTTDQPAVTTANQPSRLIDQMNRTVEVKSNPKRIISLAPSNTEILFALGLGDRVVGRTDYCNYPPEALDVPSIGGFSTPNLEEVVALQPDLVLATSIHEEIVTRLEEKKIPVIVLNPKTIDDTLASIELIGEAAGVASAAAGLREEMAARIEAVTDKTAGLTAQEKVHTCFVVWHEPLMMAGGDTMYNEMIEMAGGINIVSDLSGYPSVDLEKVLVENPRVIIVGVGMGDGEDLPYRYLIDEPLLEGVDARKNGRIYTIDQDISGRAGPRIVDALEQFATFIHPVLYPELFKK